MIMEDGKKSVNGLNWQLKLADDRLVLEIVQKFDVPEIVARILVSRGVSAEAVQSFLYPTLKQNLPNPFSLKDMEKAATRMATAILAGEPIGIMGDYDVDGATSTAILKMFLKSCGVPVLTFIPNREDGYGPNAGKMKEFKKAGCSVIATVDCGMTAFEPIEYGTQLGLDILVLDHHEPEKKLPNAYAVVNPKRLDEDKNHPCHHLAAVGVVFLFLVALNKILRTKGFYEKRVEPNLIQYLDLVALGTVCDVVKLQGVNRLFVKSGLTQMRQGKNLGIMALAQLVGLDKAPNAYHLGYVFGPRINACGRVGKSDIGMRLLSSEDSIEALALAQELEDLNHLRRDIESDVLASAMQQVENSGLPDPFIVVAGQNWHQGVVGIVAGRLKDKYNLPVFALSIEGDEVKGSSRSVPGVDLGTLVINAINLGILSRGGGHPMAAGFSLNLDKLPAFKAYLAEQIRPETLTARPTTLMIDGVLDAGAVSINMMKHLSLLEPFGESNVEPIFVVRDLMVSHIIQLKNGHIGCSLVSKSGQYLSGIAFRAEGTPLGDFLLKSDRNYCHVAGVIKMDTWKGKTKIQIQIQDMMPTD